MLFGWVWTQHSAIATFLGVGRPRRRSALAPYATWLGCDAVGECVRAVDEDA